MLSAIVGDADEGGDRLLTLRADAYWSELTFDAGLAGRLGCDRRSPHELAIEGPAV